MPTIQQRFINSINELGQDEYKVMRYSGRGMMGRYCFAIACDGGFVGLQGHVMMDMLQDAFHAGQTTSMQNADTQLAYMDQMHEDVISINGYLTDKLGHQTVYYWPDLDPVE